MAELDPALQDEISNLQTRHTALVDAVRNYSGGSIAQATNDLLAAQAQTESTIDEREAALLGLIQRNTTEPVPSLLSDFASRTYMEGVRRLEHGVGIHDMWTIERSSVRWVWGPNGKLVEVASDQPAYAYDPTTGEPLGLSCEPGSTNFMSWSGDQSNPVYASTSDITVDGNVTNSPYGTTSGSRVSKAGSGNYKNIYQDAIISSGYYTPSVFVKKDGSSEVTVALFDDQSSGLIARVVYNFDTDSLSNDGTTDFERRIVADGWVRLYAPGCEVTIGNARLYLYPGVNIAQASEESVYVWGFQLEGSQVTSPIITQDSTVTREADSIYKPLGDEYNPNGFSVYAEARQNSDSGSVVFLNSGGLPNSIRVGLPSNNDRALFVSTNGNLQASIPLSEFTNYTPGDPAKFVLVVDPANGVVRLTINGQTVSRNVAEFPKLDEMRIGGVSGNNNNINGTIHDCIMYPTVITTSEAEAMTS